MKNLAIKALSGPLKGEVFPLKKKMIIGRSQGDIITKDLSVSEPHGEIQKQAGNRVMLLDLDSKNGVFIDGKKKSKAVLSLNTVFEVGKSSFQLVALLSLQEAWIKILEGSLKKIKSQRRTLSPFALPLEIKAVSGPLKGERLFIAYGPRVFGSGEVDMPLLDSKAPESAFKISAGKHGEALFSTNSKGHVILQTAGKPKEPGPLKGRPLKDGDMVSVGATQLIVSFKKP